MIEAPEIPELRSPIEERGFVSARAFVSGEQGQIETISVEPVDDSPASPTLYFLVGWWGAASDYIPAMQFFSDLGFRCRSFSWRGTGGSDGGSFWGFGYERDLIDVLDHFDDDRVVFIAHSGAADYVRNAVPILYARGGHSIEAVIIIAPLSRSGSMNALLTWLRPDRTGTNLYRFVRFLGSNIRGVSWFMKNELALRRVLLGDHVSMEVVRKVWNQMDECPFGRYFLSLWRFPKWLQPPETPLGNYGIRHALLLHAEYDRNFTLQRQRETADAFGAEFDILPKTCHQWFADAASFKTSTRRILRWFDAKGITGRRTALL